MVVVSGSAGSLACKPTDLYRRPPSLRGVTVPLPPPTYRDGLRISVNFEGSVPTPSQDANTFVYLWESIAEIGRYMRPDGETGDFVFEEVSITIGESCISTRYEFDAGEMSPTSYHRIELIDDDPSLCGVDACSAPDEGGACICVVEWATGC